MNGWVQMWFWPFLEGLNKYRQLELYIRPGIINSEFMNQSCNDLVGNIDLKHHFHFVHFDFLVEHEQLSFECGIMQYIHKFTVIVTYFI